jgi:hypothetical protein
MAGQYWRAVSTHLPSAIAYTKLPRRESGLGSNDLLAVSVYKFLIHFGSRGLIRVALEGESAGKRCLRDSRDNLVRNLHFSGHQSPCLLTGELEAYRLKMPTRVIPSITHGGPFSALPGRGKQAKEIRS